jgi:hypothetical protein
MIKHKTSAGFEQYMSMMDKVNDNFDRLFVGTEDVEIDSLSGITDDIDGAVNEVESIVAGDPSLTQLVSQLADEEFHTESTKLMVERNIVRFDRATALAQLEGAICLVLARRTGDPMYRLYKKAALQRRIAKGKIKQKFGPRAKPIAVRMIKKRKFTS